MEAVGTQVIIAITPAIIIVALVLYSLRDKIKRLFIKIFGDGHYRAVDPIDEHPRYGGGQCSICLQNPKKFQISITCGHSFCSRCLLSLYDRAGTKIPCPLCRRVITTIFKSFPNNEGEGQERRQIQAKIHEYNERFDDNRPWIRRISEFPYVFRRIRHLLITPYFIAMFLRSIYFIRSLMFIIFYLILPMDILPEKFLGILGLIDDFLIMIFLLIFAASLFALVYIRQRGGR